MMAGSVWNIAYVSRHIECAGWNAVRVPFASVPCLAGQAAWPRVLGRVVKMAMDLRKGI